MFNANALEDALEDVADFVKGNPKTDWLNEDKFKTYRTTQYYPNLDFTKAVDAWVLVRFQILAIKFMFARRNVLFFNLFRVLN